MSLQAASRVRLGASPGRPEVPHRNGLPSSSASLHAHLPFQDIRNTVGNIPMEWYQEFPHVGYDLDGRKIFRPVRTKDELDKFLEKMESPDYW